MELQIFWQALGGHRSARLMSFLSSLHTYVHIYSAGVIGVEVDLIVLRGFVHKPIYIYPSLLKWSSHVLTVAHMYSYVT